MYTKTKLRRAQNWEKFEVMYKQLEEIYINEFKQIATKKNKRLWICFGLMLATIVMLTVIFIQSIGNSTNFSFIILAMVCFMGAIIVIGVGSPKERKFVSEFKQRIIGYMLKEMNPNINYYPICQDKKDILASYESMGFERSNCGSEYVDDEIAGSVGENIDVRISNIAINRHSGKNTRQVFNGLFAEFKLNKKIGADIRILLPTTGYLGKAQNCKSIKLDNPEFEKIFNIYTDNQIIANQILTSDIMQQFKNYYDKFGMLFEIVIRDGKVGVRIDTGPMFESVALKNKLDKEDTFVYYSVLNFIFDLIKDIYNIIENTDI